MNQHCAWISLEVFNIASSNITLILGRNMSSGDLGSNFIRDKVVSELSWGKGINWVKWFFDRSSLIFDKNVFRWWERINWVKGFFINQSGSMQVLEFRRWEGINRVKRFFINQSRSRSSLIFDEFVFRRWERVNRVKRFFFKQSWFRVTWVLLS